MDPITLALANQYTADTAAGMGAVQGKPGPQGPVGPTGPQGPIGPAGPTGAKGEPGTNGVSPTVSVAPNSSNDGTVVTITDANGAKSFEVLNGENGADGATGPQGTPGTPGATGPAGPQGAQGIQGDPGEPFLIYKVYPTKADMDAGYATDGLQEGQLVGISTETGGDDGGHLYIKGATAYEFFFDLATVDGIAGPQGPQGIQGPTGPAGAVGPQGSPGAAGADGEDGFSPTVAVSEITGGHNVTITDASGPHSFDVMDGESGSGTGEDSFVTFKDQTITTPSELETAIGHRPYYGCIHAINTRILGMAFTNDIVWIAYQLVSGTYYLDLVTADGHCEAWSSANFSVTFSSISSTKFLLEDELDLAEGTTFIGYFVSPPEVSSTVSMHPDWFIGKKPTVGEQYRGKARNNVNKWWNMVVNVVGTFDNEGITMYTVEVVSVTEIGELPTGGTAGQILSKKTATDYDTEWIDAPQGGGGDSTILVKSPVGTIVIWSGTADNIPAGWQLCDGTNGTPDLRDKFVLGAGTNHAVGETGGSETVALTVAQMPSHDHVEQVPGTTIGAIETAYYPSTETGSSSSKISPSKITGVTGKILTTKMAGSSQPHPNIPPYYTLCYIMKLTADPAVDGVTMDDVNTAIDTKLDAYEPQEVYSTEETRIGTWIDGKPLYRKTFVLTTPTVLNTTTNVGTIPTSLAVVRMSCLLNYELGVCAVPNYLKANGTDTFVSCIIERGVIYISISHDVYKNKSVFLTLEYTKTTDQSQTVAANTVLKASSKAPALNAIQSAAVTASGASEIKNIQT